MKGKPPSSPSGPLNSPRRTGLAATPPFAWSFYSQGTREQQAGSSDLFLKEALTFFGDDADKAFAASPAGAFEKGQRLARIVGQRRSLLILDGLEPLQYAPTSSTPGQLKDRGIAALLKGLAAASHGLCLVTTRYSLPDLRAFWQTTAPEMKLLRLSREAGVSMLKALGVRGSERRNIPVDDDDPDGEKVNEFEKLVEDVKGHALTLMLLGSYLNAAHGGDIRKRDLVKLKEADDEIEVIPDHPRHAFNVMDAYVEWFETGGKNEEENKQGLRALALLRLLGLFDRPATADCLNALWHGEGIVGLTESLIGLSESQRNTALKRLEDARLLTVNRDPSRALLSLDTHPHIREYFAKQLRERNPDAWRAAHRRLYEHLCATTQEGNQPTLEDLQLLYQAVAHGCQAGLTEETRAKVYLDRILRGREHYTWHKLGAYGSELGAQACFFEQPWSRLSPGIREPGWMLNETACCLRALGRLSEALEPMRVGLQNLGSEETWESAAASASNLSELELTLGEVAGAVGDVEQSVTYADRSGDAFWRLCSRITEADALHQAGRRAEAETRFREAEQMQQERQPDYPRLYSVQGFRYCDLLLAALERAAWQTILECGGKRQRDAALGSTADEATPAKAPSPLRSAGAVQECRAVSQRAAQTLKWGEMGGQGSLLDIALDHLTLGRTALYAGILEGRAGSPLPAADNPTCSDGERRARSDAPYLETARRELDAAVDGLRRANSLDHVPRGLLTRAWLRFLTGARTGPASAQEDLDEAWEIAERGPMKLFLADIHLHRARLFGMQKEEGRMRKYPWESPAADLAAAEKLINSCGYHRRDEELADAKRAILGS